MPSSIKSTQLEQHLIQDMYLQHHDWLVHWLQRRLRHPFSAADIVQDTFVKILQVKQRVFHIEDSRAYLINTAKHVLIDQHRRYMLERSYLESVYDELSAQGLALDSEQMDEAIAILELLHLALKDSSLLARKAFLLYYLEGYNQTEIAARIGKSLRTTQLYLGECLSLCYSAKQSYWIEQ
jgi:RNA polymerase sigma factor (sigma-70 family)